MTQGLTTFPKLCSTPAADSTSLANKNSVSGKSSCVAQGILGTGSALPARAVSNQDLTSFLDTTHEWIVERVGIHNRYVAGPDEGVEQLAYQASLRALEAAGVKPSEIDVIILASVTTDHNLPASAAIIQQMLGCDGAMAFDIRAACSGFLYALTIADGLQKSHGFRRALVIGSETLSRIVDWTDRQTCVLFGDGAGAVVLGYDGVSNAAKDFTQSGVIASDIHNDGNKCDLILREGRPFPASTLPESIVLASEYDGSPYIQMKGREVFKMAVSAMTDSVLAVLEKSGYSLEDIDLFIPHQSNQRIIDATCERLGLANTDKVVLNLDRIANTSAASIPIALDEIVRAGRVAPGNLIVMTAVGAGISYGTILFRW